MKFSLFFIAFLGAMLILNVYIYRRFLHKLHHPFNKWAFVVPSVLMFGEILFVVEALTHAITDSPRVYYVLASSIGITFLLFVVAVFYDLNLSLFKKVPYQQSRRKFIKIIFDVTILILAFSYLLKGLKGGLSKPILNTINVDIDKFNGDSFTIIQLSDVHVGRTLKRDFVEDLVKRTNSENPDIVVLTGDLVDADIQSIKHDLLALKKIKAPTYFILGNHEYFHNASESIKYMKELGIIVLLNENLIINNSFNLIGLNDLIGERIGQYPIDIKKAYKGIDESLPSIVLAHQPKTILRLQDRACDLMLSGHTHGGQIFPFGLLVMLDQPYLAGLYQHSSSQQVFVSRGAGYWGPPIRVLAPSEISKIIIRASS